MVVFEKYRYQENDNKEVRKLKEQLESQKLGNSSKGNIRPKSLDDVSRRYRFPADSTQQETDNSVWRHVGLSPLSNYTPFVEGEGKTPGDKMVDAIDRTILRPTEKAVITTVVWSKTLLSRMRDQLASKSRSGKRR